VTSFDSRALQFGDSLTQQFLEVGTLTYQVVLAHTVFGGERNRFVIDVLEGDIVQPTQHFIKVFFSDGTLQVEPPRLTISVKDTVSWSAVDRQVPPFRVLSLEDSALYLDSAAIKTNAVFTHAFGVPGRYTWSDANRGTVEGVVMVEDPRITSVEDLAAYKRRLSSLRQIKKRKGKGEGEQAIFMIDGETSEPATVSVLTGQTVMWVVMNTEGISITEQEIEAENTREASAFVRAR